MPAAPPPPEAAQERPARRVKITADVIDAHGFSDRCRKCSLLRQRRSAAGAMHSEECRARFEALLRAAEDPRIQRADARVTERLAADVQAEEERARGAQETAPGRVEVSLDPTGSPGRPAPAPPQEEPAQEERPEPAPATPVDYGLEAPAEGGQPMEDVHLVTDHRAESRPQGDRRQGVVRPDGSPTVLENRGVPRGR